MMNDNDADDITPMQKAAIIGGNSAHKTRFHASLAGAGIPKGRASQMHNPGKSAGKHKGNFSSAPGMTTQTPSKK